MSAHQILRPVNPMFIWFSLLLSVVLNAIPLDPVSFWPDWVLLVLTFWCVHQSRRVGLTTVFILGLITDVHHGSILGQNVMVYVTTAWLASTFQNRLLWFSVWGQMFQILPLFLASQFISLALGVLRGGNFPGWELFAAPVIQTFLWPVVTIALLAPQRRSSESNGRFF